MSEDNGSPLNVTFVFGDFLKGLIAQAGKLPVYAVFVSSRVLDTLPAPQPKGKVRLSAEGKWVALSPADNTVKRNLPLGGTGDFADYNIEIKEGMPALTMGHADSIRVYVSIGEKLYFRATDDGGRVDPAVWPGTNDTNQQTVFDWIELNFAPANKGTKGGKLNANTTMVDMFSIALSFTATGAKGVQTSGGFVKGLHDGRQQIFDSFTNTDMQALVDKSTATGVPGFKGPLRVLAPVHGVEKDIHGKPLISEAYLDAHIDAVWKKYQSTTLKFNGNQYGQYTAQVQGDQFVFTPVDPKSKWSKVAFSKPSTYDALKCDGAIGMGGKTENANPMVSGLGAGLNRGTLLNSDVVPPTGAKFYDCVPTNLYSKIMHECSINGLAYGFAYDDNMDMSTSIADENATDLQLTIEL